LTASNYGWTITQERVVIDTMKEEKYYREDGRVKNGIYAMIGEKIGKTRIAVKNKVHEMKRAGRL
jgi:hypothetical protein